MFDFGEKTLKLLPSMPSFSNTNTDRYADRLCELEYKKRKQNLNFRMGQYN